MSTRYGKLYQASSRRASPINSPGGYPFDYMSMDQILTALKKHPGFESADIKNLNSMRSPNETNIAIEIMAETRAYFQVAYKRYSDVIALQIDKTLVREFGGSLRTELLQGLGIFSEGGKETCALWLAEDPVAVERRKDLIARKEVLQAALRKLQSVSF